MELYLDLLSQPCRTVFIFAKAVGIPFEFKHVSLTAGKFRRHASAQGFQASELERDFTLSGETLRKRQSEKHLLTWEK